MLSRELKKLLIELEQSPDEVINLNREKLILELKQLDNIDLCLQESLSLSDKVCPTCGRGLL